MSGVNFFVEVEGKKILIFCFMWQIGFEMVLFNFVVVFVSFEKGVFQC